MDQEYLEIRQVSTAISHQIGSRSNMAEVLFGTSILRHSTVHRLSISVAEILNMLSYYLCRDF